MLDGIVENEELLQTDKFNEVYSTRFEYIKEELQSEYLFNHINDLYTCIISDHGSKLTNDQKKSLSMLFFEFDEIQKIIDPARLKEFKYCLSNDGELLLYRKTNIGLSNIIIDDELCIAFSFIPYDSSKKSKLEYFEIDNLETPALLLFSY